MNNAEPPSQETWGNFASSPKLFHATQSNSHLKTSTKSCRWAHRQTRLRALAAISGRVRVTWNFVHRASVSTTLSSSPVRPSCYASMQRSRATFAKWTTFSRARRSRWPSAWNARIWRGRPRPSTTDHFLSTPTSRVCRVFLCSTLSAVLIAWLTFQRPRTSIGFCGRWETSPFSTRTVSTCATCACQSRMRESTRSISKCRVFLFCTCYRMASRRGQSTLDLYFRHRLTFVLCL